jgi:hypothetical protein
MQGRGISQTPKDIEHTLPTISLGGLLGQSEGNEFIITLTRLRRFQGGRKAREDAHPLFCIRYCWVVPP